MEYDPARLLATVYRRYKYKRSTPNGSMEFFIASLPAEKDKSLATPSLKSHVTTEMFLWHMPIHRQMQKFTQSGIILSENTIGDWINGTCRSLTAIYDALRQNIVKPACDYMMADETRIDVLDSEKVKGKNHIWVGCGAIAILWIGWSSSNIIKGEETKIPDPYYRTIKAIYIVTALTSISILGANQA